MTSTVAPPPYHHHHHTNSTACRFHPRLNPSALALGPSSNSFDVRVLTSHVAPHRVLTCRPLQSTLSRVSTLVTVRVGMREPDIHWPLSCSPYYITCGVPHTSYYSYSHVAYARGRYFVHTATNRYCCRPTAL